VEPDLEERVAAQLGEIEKVGRLKRFLAPQLAEMIVSSGDESILESHRRDIVVVFCDLRGYTAFAETGEPRKSGPCCASSMPHSVPLSVGSRAPSIISRATG